VLTDITLPENVNSLGAYAFGYCSALPRIRIPDQVTNIGRFLFWHCKALEEVILPESANSIEGYAFYGCSNLTGIKLPAGIRLIGEAAFGYCSSLRSISIPEGVKEILKETFYSCSKLETITFSPNIKSIGELLTYTSANPKIATVSASGVVKGIKYGRTDIIITAADSGNISGAATKIQVDVTPSGTSLKNVKSPAKGRLTIYWKKNKTAKGYEIQLSRSLAFTTGTKSFTLKNNKKRSITIGGLPKGKKYYVRMRAYQRAGGKTIKGPWSKIKSLVIKK